MKIESKSTSNESNKRPNLFQQFVLWPIMRYPFMILAVIGFLAGFLYSWQFFPQSNLDSLDQANISPLPLTPTPEAPLTDYIEPILEMSISVDRSGANSSNDQVQLQLNDERPVTIQASLVFLPNGQIASWRLAFPKRMDANPLSGTLFELIPAPAGKAVATWTYLTQLQQAGIQVPVLTICLVSFNGEAAEPYYLIQLTSDPQQTPGFVFELPDTFFSTATDENLIQQISFKLLANQKTDLTRIQQEGLELLTFLIRHPGEIPQALDTARFASYFAIHDLWGVTYPDGILTRSYFYNAESKLIEPVVLSPLDLSLSSKREEITFPFSGQSLFQIPAMQMAYIQAVSNLTLPEAYQNFKNQIFPVFHAHEKQIRLANNTPYSSTWETLDFRNTMLHLQTQPAYPLRAFVHAGPDTSCVNVNLLNLMRFPVDVTTLYFHGHSIPLDPDWVSSFGSHALLDELPKGLRLAAYQSTENMLGLCIPSDIVNNILLENEIKDTLEESLQDENAWQLQAQVSGLPENYLISMIPEMPPQAIANTPVPAAMTAEILFDTFPFIRLEDDQKTLTLTAGDWIVKQDLVIPAGYQVILEEGINLSFAPQAVFLSYSALKAQGTSTRPIVLTASEESWPGLVVLNAGEYSTLTHTIIEHTSGIARQGWILTGGVTFYRSPVKILKSTIQRNFTEDAINVIRSEFRFEELTIKDTPSDAFDGDFTTGEIFRCTFEDIGGDAIDISGSTVVVADSVMLRIADKGLSVGEKSQLTAEGLTLTDVGMGGVSKDLSHLLIQESVIQNAKIAGLAAYIKKAVFGPSTIQAVDVEILDTDIQTLVQTGSVINLNGKEQPSRELDVKTLYALGILGN